MIRKTDRYIKREAFVWERGYIERGQVTEIARRETWWLLWAIPIYSRDTILSKPV